MGQIFKYSIAVSLLISMVSAETQLTDNGIIKIPLSISLLDFGFFSDVSIGTPPQNFTLSFATDSPYFWVPSQDCTKRCGPNRFSGNQSSTYQPTQRQTDIRDRHFNFHGSVSRDTIRLSSLMVKNQEFIEIHNTTTQIQVGKSNGLLGLAPSGEGVTTLLQNILTEKLLPSPVFSFGVNIVGPSNISADFYLGGSPKNLYRDPMMYYSTSSPNRWEVEAKKVGLGGLTLCEGKCKIVFDSSTMGLVIPEKQFFRFLFRIGGMYTPGSGILFVLCPLRFLSPDLHVFLDHGKVVFPKKYFILEQKDDQNQSFCFPVVSTTSSDDTFTFGNLFFAHTFTEFDFENKRIGFALRK